MVKLPALKPKEVVKTLLKFGFEVKRQTGSHIRLIHPDGRTTTIAMHKRDLPKGTLKAILKQSELTLDEFLKKV
jgi:predicted RNA binding protein YcfA (HicA-like mRNA interferase family)